MGGPDSSEAVMDAARKNSGYSTPSVLSQGEPASGVEDCSPGSGPNASTVDTADDGTPGESALVSYDTRVATFNIENFYTNKLYLDALMKTYRIIALQEHWLYNFEQKEIVAFCAERNFNVAIKSVDDDDPLSPHCRPRGMGGVALMLDREIDSRMKIVLDGGRRILVKFAFYYTGRFVHCECLYALQGKSQC